jgi:hypothetical protein
VEIVSDGNQSSTRRYLTIAAEVATVLALLITAGGLAISYFARQGDASGKGESAVQTSAAATSKGGGTPPISATPTRTAQQIYLTGLSPETGANRRTELPRPLAGTAGYENTVVIGCPTNQTGDLTRSVVYDLRNRYTAFHAKLRPFLNAPDESKVRFEVFVDSDLPARRDVKVNATDTVDVDVAGHKRMELRISCESPDATAIFADAYLVHAG